MRLLKAIDAGQLALCARIVDGLSDPLRRNRVALLAAFSYAAGWAIYAIVAKSSQGINADLGEMVVWARNLDWGYPKHPPLPAWILAGWFSIFPQADWAYYLLAGANLGLGLYISYLLAGLWLDGAKRAVAPFLLALIPFYNFIGLKWDQNSILIPLWALTTWAFVKSFRDRHAGYAALAGAAAAASMLTKYWSVFLLFAIVVAALSDRRRLAYFRSAAPWVTVLTGAALMAPHVLWLIRNDFPPLRWVENRRAAANLMDWLGSLSEYSFGTLGYAAVALVTFAVLVRPSLAALRDTVFPRDDRLRMALIIFWLPLLAPIAVATVTRTNLLSLWNTESLALLPVVLLASPLITVSRNAASRIVGTAILVLGFALLSSPITAVTKLNGGVENDALYVPAATAAIEQEWKAATDRRLEILAGPSLLTTSVAFKLKDSPSTYADFSAYVSPWADEQALQHKGLAVICPSRDTGCVQNLDTLAKSRPVARRATVTLTPRLWGFAGTSDNFVIAIMLPR
jgi:4-amino-4-deoxy-L-arabinose transferase-like glycosyltransferase